MAGSTPILTPEELAVRLRRLGWEGGIANNGHYQFGMSGERIDYPSTPGDGRRWYLNLLRDLKRRGTPCALAAREALINGERRAKLKPVKISAPPSIPEIRPLDLSLVAKGVRCPDGPLTDEIPLAPALIDDRFGIPLGGGLRGRVVRVTPEVAGRWLAAYHGPNRSKADGHAEKLADAIRGGDWRLNGDAVRFDLNSQLFDGQHRLTACVAADKAIETLVVWGAKPREAQQTTDLGTRRTFRHQLEIEGGWSYTPHLAAALQLLHRMREPGAFASSGAARPQELWALLETDIGLYSAEVSSWRRGLKPPKDASNMAAANRWAKRLRWPGAVTPIAATAHLMRKADGEGGYTEIFWDTVTSRDPASYDGVTDPRWALHALLVQQGAAKHVSDRRLPTQDICARIIKAWNAWVDGTPVQQLSWRGGGPRPEAFPVPRVVEPASAA